MMKFNHISIRVRAIVLIECIDYKTPESRLKIQILPTLSFTITFCFLLRSLCVSSELHNTISGGCGGSNDDDDGDSDSHDCTKTTKWINGQYTRRSIQTHGRKWENPRAKKIMMVECIYRVSSSSSSSCKAKKLSYAWFVQKKYFF